MDETVIFNILEFITAGCSTVICSLLLYLIARKTPKELKEYRFFLFQITLSDMIFEIFVIFLMQPEATLPIIGSVIRGPLRYLGQTAAAFISFSLSEYLFAYCVLNINFAFLYRYANLTNPKLHKFLIKKATLFGLYLMTVPICFVMPCVQWSNLMEKQLFLSRYYAIFPDRNGTLDNETVFVFGDRNLGLKYFSLPAIAISAFLNVLLAYLIIKKLQRFRSIMSTKTYRQHIRLTFALLVQSFSPLLLCAGPVCVLSISLLLGVDTFRTRTFGGVLVLMLAAHPLVNAISTLVFVGQYRQLVFDFFKFRIMQQVRQRRPTITVTMPMK